MNLLLSLRKNIGNSVPYSFRSFFLKHFSFIEKRTEWWLSKDPYRNDPPYSEYHSPYPFKLGIIKEFWHRHTPYIAACREMKVAYELIDITSSNWFDNIKNSSCDGFLIVPSVQLSQWKTLYDERLRIMVNDLGKTIFPSYNELWLYESKRRMAYWLEANDIPHAKTHVFYDKKEALEYAATCQYPVVAKTNMGARAAGVHIFRSSSKLISYIKEAFGKGIIHDDGDPHDPDWGYVLFQEYIPCRFEWRIINIGPFFMGHQKLKKGDFCSGSGMVGWVRPTDKVLDLVRTVLEKGHFQTADIDIFEGEDGNLYVNEIQAIFGSIRPYQMLDHGIPGYLTRSADDQWIFHQAVVCQNASSNLRVAALIKKLGYDIELPSLPLDVVDQEDIDNSISLSSAQLPSEKSTE